MACTKELLMKNTYFIYALLTQICRHLFTHFFRKLLWTESANFFAFRMYDSKWPVWKNCSWRIHDGVYLGHETLGQTIDWGWTSEVGMSHTTIVQLAFQFVACQHWHWFLDNGGGIYIGHGVLQWVLYCCGKASGPLVLVAHWPLNGGNRAACWFSNDQRAFW